MAEAVAPIGTQQRSIEDRISAAMSAPEAPPPDDGTEPDEEDEATEQPEPASAGDDASEPEAEGEEGAAEEAESESDASDLSSLTYPVTVDGEVKEIPLADLAKGYLQERDYTQKTQALAEQRRAHEAERSSWNTQRAQIAQQLDAIGPVIVEALQADAVPAERLAELRQTDPGEYSRIVLEKQEREAKLQRVVQARMAMIRQEQAEAHAASEAAKPAARAKLMTTVSAFRETDREKSPDGFNYEMYDAVGKYVLGKGLKAEEWGAITDPRYVEIAYWAMIGEKAARTVKKAQPKLEQLRKPIRPGGTGSTPTPREADAREARALRAKAKQSGSVHDAAARIARLGLS